MTHKTEVSATTVDDLMSKAFAPGRDPRSDAYKNGVRSMLACHIEGTPMRCPYNMGTSRADAFYAGADEGCAVWSKFLASGTQQSGAVAAHPVAADMVAALERITSEYRAGDMTIGAIEDAEEALATARSV